jgi:Asp-tRNA(Asn)/Glu-tRNA(Gln) amidotransferase A subunit family amidase
MIQPASLDVTASALRSGQLDLLAYINALCDRIDTHDPQIQALLPEANRRARLLSEAEALRARFPDPVSRPLLYGIPVGVKDMFYVDGFPTRAGSRLPEEAFSGKEAACVTMLREAGALILGKTVSTEFAYFEPGPTRNPHNLNHTPGGSSSGSAAAVAAGFCPLALGTQTIGSTIRPAAFCGVVGFKPSYERISAMGVIPCAPSVDTVGLFTQDVEGMALAAALLCRDWRSASTSPALPIFGVPDGPYLAQASQEGLNAFAQHISLLEQVGYTVKRVPVMPDIEEINQRHMLIVCAEMAAVHAEWFAHYQPLYRPRTTEAIRKGQQVGAEELAAARAGRLKLRHELQTLMLQEQIDLWLCPAAPGSAPEGIQTTGSAIMNLPWTHAGLPAVTLPAGAAPNGLPLGLQVVGAYMADEQLLAWATAIGKMLA